MKQLIEVFGKLIGVFKYIPDDKKLPAYALTIYAFVVLSILIADWSGVNVDKPVYYIIGCSIILVPIFVIRGFAAEGKSKIQKVKDYEIWRRRLLDDAMSQDEFDQLDTLLKNLRNDIYIELQKSIKDDMLANFTVNQVRVNIFLPDTRMADNGEVCRLSIRKGMQIGLESPESEIVFRPHEGLTGRTFSNGRSLGVRRTTENRLLWRAVNVGQGGADQQFNMSQEQEKIIHSNLEWVISFPLESDRKAFGVLNIDAITLGHQYYRQEVEAVMKNTAGNSNIREKIGNIERMLSTHANQEILIARRKVES